MRYLNMMIKELSILIPIFNDDASRLVEAVSRQAQSIDGLCYEIVVFDDGSTDESIKSKNLSLEKIPFCRFVFSPHHACRAAMRNAMSRCGKYDWHLMIDARLTLVHDDFLLRYLQSGVSVGCAAVGGVCVDGGDKSAELYCHNLRFRYEKYEERYHSLSERLSNPYKSFRTTNFFYHRSVLQRVAYDESIIGYGYEDVLLGKQLEQAGISVLHIDNPVAYTSFEDNRRYLSKLEEALLTLRQNSSKLEQFSPLHDTVSKLDALHLLWLVKCWHRLFARMELSVLCGASPKLAVLKLYKLGYYASLA